MITLTREEMVDEISDALSNACDMDVTWGQYAEAVVKCLEGHGAAFARPPHAPCPSCGKPANTVSCPMGGCPLGADL